MKSENSLSPFFVLWNEVSGLFCNSLVIFQAQVNLWVNIMLIIKKRGNVFVFFPCMSCLLCAATLTLHLRWVLLLKVFWMIENFKVPFGVRKPSGQTRLSSQLQKQNSLQCRAGSTLALGGFYFICRRSQAKTLHNKPFVEKDDKRQRKKKTLLEI